MSTSSDSVLALAPALSSTSQAIPPSSRASFQCRQGLLAALWSRKRTELEIARRQNVPDFAHKPSLNPPPLHRLDQHGAALPAADAFGGDALLDAEPLHRVDEMQHDPVAAGADRMAEADGAAVDVELVA